MQTTVFGFDTQPKDHFGKPLSVGDEVILRCKVNHIYRDGRALDLLIHNQSNPEEDLLVSSDFLMKVEEPEMEDRQQSFSFHVPNQEMDPKNGTY